MKKKKFPIKVTKFKTRRNRHSNIDGEDDYIDEHDSEASINLFSAQDEFESLQDISENPGTLHCEVEEEDTEEEEHEEGVEVKSEKTEEDESSLKARGNKNKHYVKPEEFETLIKEYYSHGELTNDLCDCVYKIANRLSYRPNFLNYSYREEMVGDAIERMIFALSNRIYKYNPKKIGKNGKKGNAFLYFTKIAENAFINRIKIETKNKNTIDKYQEDVYYNLLQKGIDIGSGSKMYNE